MQNIKCDFASISTGIECKNEYWNYNGSYLLKDCKHDISQHLKIFGISKLVEALPESELILLRSFGSMGFISDFRKFDNFCICASHRFFLGKFASFLKNEANYN
jgi:hypothetical protein